jgi:hypothetical protein
VEGRGSESFNDWAWTAPKIIPSFSGKYKISGTKALASKRKIQ